MGRHIYNVVLYGNDSEMLCSLSMIGDTFISDYALMFASQCVDEGIVSISFQRGRGFKGS